MARILVVDDQADMRSLLRERLQHEGWIVDEAGDGDAAVELFARTRPNLVILDFLLPRRNGFQVAEAIRELAPIVPIVMISGVFKNPRVRVDAFERYRVVEYLEKPFDLETMIEVARDLLRVPPPLDAGEREMVIPIQQDPTDPEPYLVYADWLQLRGRPRGELIVLMHQKKERDAARLIERHPELGGVTVEPRFGPMSVEWAFGFVRSLRIWIDHRHPPACILHRVKVDDATRFLRKLVLVCPSPPDPVRVPQLRVALAHAALPRHGIEVSLE